MLLLLAITRRAVSEQPTHMSRDPVESLAEELLGLGEYSPSACLDLLRLYAQSKPEAHRRPLLDNGDPESISLSLASIGMEVV